MTVLSSGARVRRGGRTPGWVLLTTLLVLAIGASSVLAFTNRAELLKLVVILALWAAVAGAFASVLYRRQAEADQARARDLKVVYDLQLDREISARREYELTVESQLRRELASELRAQATDEVAALRAELTALRTSLEILFDTDLRQHPAIETLEREASTARMSSDWAQNGAQNGESPPTDWLSSDRVTAVRDDPNDADLIRTDENPIIDVPEEPLLPPREPTVPTETQPEPLGWPSEPAAWQPVPADGQWLSPATSDSNWASVDDADTPATATSGRRRRARHCGPEGQVDSSFAGAVGRHFDEAGPASRHSSEYREQPPPAPDDAPLPPEPASRHRGAEHETEGAEPSGASRRDPESGGRSVADLLARLQVEPPGGGRRRRRQA